jgi:hypothetical protein
MDEMERLRGVEWVCCIVVDGVLLLGVWKSSRGMKRDGCVLLAVWMRSRALRRGRIIQTL